MWAKPPFHCCPVPSGHSALFHPLPLSLHLLCLSLWLLTGSQGSSSPSSPGLSFSATQSFISGTIHWPLGRKQSGLRFWLREGRPGQSHSGSSTDPYSALHLPFILSPPQNFNLYTNSTLLCQRHATGGKSLPIGWDPQTAADLRSCAHGEQSSPCHQATSP